MNSAHRAAITGKPGLASRLCMVPGCVSAAPGTHVFCRPHARQIPPDVYRTVRFRPEDETMSEALAMITA